MLPKYSPVSICAATITSNEIPDREKKQLLQQR